jgi:hypothetical protein
MIRHLQWQRVMQPFKPVPLQAADLLQQVVSILALVSCVICPEHPAAAVAAGQTTERNW